MVLKEGKYDVSFIDGPERRVDRIFTASWLYNAVGVLWEGVQVLKEVTLELVELN